MWLLNFSFLAYLILHNLFAKHLYLKQLVYIFLKFPWFAIFWLYLNCWDYPSLSCFPSYLHFMFALIWYLFYLKLILSYLPDYHLFISQYLLLIHFDSSMSSYQPYDHCYLISNSYFHLLHPPHLHLIIHWLECFCQNIRYLDYICLVVLLALFHPQDFYFLYHNLLLVWT